VPRKRAGTKSAEAAERAGRNASGEVDSPDDAGTAGE
jgi:hypothetical protein